MKIYLFMSHTESQIWCQKSGTLYEYGLYILLGSFVGYISLLDFGLSNTIVRFVAKYRANNDTTGEKNFLGTVLIIYVLISFLVVVLGAIGYFNLDFIFQQSLTPEELEKSKILMMLFIFNMTIGSRESEDSSSKSTISIY